VVSLAAALATALLSGCGTAGDATPARAQTTAEAPARRVTTAPPERGTIRRETSEPGQVEAFETVEILARVPGYVRRMAVDLGDRVDAGQVLAELEAPELEAEHRLKLAHLDQDAADLRKAGAMVSVAEAAVTTAEAGVEHARAAIRRTEAEVARWQAEYDRIDRLVSDRAVTEGLRDETLSKLEAARAGQEEARAQVALAEAALAQSDAEREKAVADVAVAEAHVRFAEADARLAETMVGFTRITSPFAGVVTRRLVDTGHLTDPGASDPLLTVSRTDIVRVSVGVPEVDAPLVDVGDPARIRLQALEGRTFEGEVSRTSWALDQSTRTLRAEIDLENPEGVLQPGLYVYVTIIAEERPDVLSLPESAILRDPAGNASCMVAEDGQARRMPIGLGLSDGDRVEVVSGLSGSEAVITSDPASVEEGQPVTPSG
jgi:RND family efflux transporter MFP subunit